MDVGVRLLRNGTEIGVRTKVAYHLEETTLTIPVAVVFVDSGASTATTTYTLQAKSNRSTCTPQISGRAMLIHYAFR